MKKAFITLALFVSVLILLAVNISAANPQSSNSFKAIWKAINDLREQVAKIMNILESNPNTKHLTFHYKECDFVEDVGDVGWCPDEISSDFTILDNDYSESSVIDPQVSTEFTEPHVIKIMDCRASAVVFDSQNNKYARIVCPAQPLGNSVLSYTLTN